jgi:hypothetical protein
MAGRMSGSFTGWRKKALLGSRKGAGMQAKKGRAFLSKRTAHKHKNLLGKLRIGKP